MAGGRKEAETGRREQEEGLRPQTSERRLRQERAEGDSKMLSLRGRRQAAVAIGSNVAALDPRFRGGDDTLRPSVIPAPDRSRGQAPAGIQRTKFVIPAKAGIQGGWVRSWTPASAGVTTRHVQASFPPPIGAGGRLQRESRAIRTTGAAGVGWWLCVAFGHGVTKHPAPCGGRVGARRGLQCERPERWGMGGGCVMRATTV